MSTATQGELFPELVPAQTEESEDINQTGITPVGYKMLLELPKSAEIQKAEANGVVIPEFIQDKFKAASVVARVLAMGKDCYTDKVKYPGGPWCKVGDYVVMSPYMGIRTKSVITGIDYRLVNEDNIDAVVPSPEFVERG